MDNNKHLVKSLCPICGERIVMRVSEMPNEDRQQIEEALEKSPSNSIFYKGSKWIFQNSVALLADSYGIPSGFGKSAATAITNMFDSMLEEHEAEVRAGLERIPRSIYLMEFVCENCEYVINRYYSYQ